MEKVVAMVARAAGRSLSRTWQLVVGVGAIGLLAFAAWLSIPVRTPLPGLTTIRPPDEVMTLAIQGDTLWAGGRDGLYAIDRHTSAVAWPIGFDDVRYVKAVLVDRQGALWIGHERGLSILKDSVRRDIAESDRLLTGPALSLLEDRAGNIWLGGAVGIARFDGSGWTRVAVPEAFALPTVDVIFEDSSGVLWFGSSAATNGGLVSLDRDTWRRYGTADGLAHNTVNAIAQDQEGALWFATGHLDRGGASRLLDGRWTTLTQREGLAGEKVRSVFEDRESRLWFGSEYYGIAIRDRSGFRALTPQDGLAGWEAKAIVQDDDGVYWIGTDAGLNRLDPSASPEFFEPGGRRP